ncbi:MAG: hypothetical protein JWM40_2234 [Frankiales bacterium]|nr:hypothetical protein [Frankiales bacterium]
MKIALLVPILVAPLLLSGCTDDGTTATPQGTENPDVAASAPIAGVTLPPDALVDQVLRPDEVPAGMVPILLGSGPRDAKVVASYSGTGATATAAAARLKAHSFQSAYVAQYANQATAQVIVVLASRFGTPANAAADFGDDLRGSTSGKAVPSATVGDESAVTVQTLPGTPKTAKAAATPKTDLVLVRFRRGAMTWSLAYRAPSPADVQLPIQLATRLLARTAA